MEWSGKRSSLQSLKWLRIIVSSVYVVMKEATIHKIAFMDVLLEGIPCKWCRRNLITIILNKTFTFDQFQLYNPQCSLPQGKTKLPLTNYQSTKAIITSHWYLSLFLASFLGGGINFVFIDLVILILIDFLFCFVGDFSDVVLQLPVRVREVPHCAELEPELLRDGSLHLLGWVDLGKYLNTKRWMPVKT